MNLLTTDRSHALCSHEHECVEPPSRPPQAESRPSFFQSFYAPLVPFRGNTPTIPHFELRISHFAFKNPPPTLGLPNRSGLS